MATDTPHANGLDFGSTGFDHYSSEHLASGRNFDLDAMVQVGSKHASASEANSRFLDGTIDGSVSSLVDDDSRNAQGDSPDPSEAPGAPGPASVEAQDPSIPAWSELKTKAGKERKRLPLACIACRRKKIRCSGEKPACKHCLRSRIPCVYKVTTRKAAPRTDYMAMLDKRLKRMEERVIRVIPREEQPDALAATGRANVRPPLPPPPPKPNAKKRGAEQAFSEEVDEWARARPTETKADKIPAQGAETDRLGVKDAEEYSLLREGADKLPTREVQEHLTEVFFEFVYCQSYPLLHKPSFLRKLAQGTVPPVLMLSICAISARFSNHTAVQGEPAFLRGETWATPAREIALRRYDAPNITILICYLILGLHEFGTCQGGRSWMLAGMAQRMAYALQLHRDLGYDPKFRHQEGKKDGLTSTDREIRRRTMWACFLMDRFTSSGTERPVFVDEQYIQAQLPVKESFFQKEITAPTEDLEGHVPNPVQDGAGQVSDAKANMGVAAYTIRLVAIWGKIIHYLNLSGKDRDEHPMWSEQSKFSALKRSTEKWMQDLPENLSYTPDNLQTHASERIANQFLFMHLVYNQIILFTNRFALPTPGSRASFPKDMPVEFVQEASKHAFDAANQISALVNEAMEHSVVAPFAGYCAFYSSTVHINGAFSKNPALEASSKQNLAWNVKYLTRMKKYWGMFHFVTENLRDLYRRHADAARQGGATSSSESTTQGIFQYGDWFDRYPHGVNGTDYEEPSTRTTKELGADAVLGQTSDLQTVEEFFSKLAPPSRSTQQQRQTAAPTPRKKKRSKSESKAKASESKHQQSTQESGNANDMGDRPEAEMEHRESMDATASVEQFGFNQFPSGVSGPPVSQLDRQMVLNSYAGFDGEATGLAPPGYMAQHMVPPPPQNAFSPYSTIGAYVPQTTPGGQMEGTGYWGDPSTAWFMPFNMQPPNVGQDSNVFGSSSGPADWSNFGTFAEMNNAFTPSGIPHSSDMNPHTNLENDGSMPGLDSL